MRRDRSMGIPSRLPFSPRNSSWAISRRCPSIFIASTINTSSSEKSSAFHHITNRYNALSQSGIVCSCRLSRCKGLSRTQSMDSSSFGRAACGRTARRTSSHTRPCNASHRSNSFASNHGCQCEWKLWLQAQAHSQRRFTPTPQTCSL